MFEVKNAIGWKTAKIYFNDERYHVYQDVEDDYRMLVFAANDEGLSGSLNELFGGDWKYIGVNDSAMLEKRHEG